MHRSKNFVIKLLRCLKIRVRLMLFLAISLLTCSLLILALSFFASHELLDGYISGYIESSQQQIMTCTESRIDEIIMLSVRLKTNQDIYDLIENNELGTKQKQNRLQMLIGDLMSHADKTSIGNIYLIGKSGNALQYRQESSDILPPDAIFIKKLRNTCYYVTGETTHDQYGNAFIPIGMTYSNFYTGQSLGYLIIYIREDSLCSSYKDIVPEWGYSFILSNNRYIISHPNKNEVGKVVSSNMHFSVNDNFSVQTENMDGKKTVVAIHRLSDRMCTIGFNWKIVSLISYEKLYHTITQIEKLLLFFGIGMLIIAMMISFIIAKNITVPLQRLKKKLNAFGEGKLDVFVEDHVNDELWELETSYNHMVVRINELIIKNNQEKEKQREMEFIALQAQINPHFLYNTLDAIGWIARLRNQNEIESLVMELANFFRLSLHKGDKFITVDEEVRLVQSFVFIEQMRNPDKFEIEYNIPDEIKGVMMPKIILQPLVENAIKHGIGEKRGKGKIVINGFRFDDDVLLEVSDDGVGFDPSKTQSIPKHNIQHSGYGLKNVNERIKLEYGKKYGIQIESKEGEGTTIKVRFCIKNYQ